MESLRGIRNALTMAIRTLAEIEESNPRNWRKAAGITKASCERIKSQLEEILLQPISEAEKKLIGRMLASLGLALAETKKEVKTDRSARIARDRVSQQLDHVRDIFIELLLANRPDIVTLIVQQLLSDHRFIAAVAIAVRSKGARERPDDGRL